MKPRVSLLLLLGILLAGAADAATITFFDSSQGVTPVASGATSDTSASMGYLFTYTRDKLFDNGNGRFVRVPWPEGLEAQSRTVPPTGDAMITISRLDGAVFDISSFMIKLLASTAGTGGSLEVMPLLNGVDAYPDPVVFDATGQANRTFSYRPPSTLPLTGFDTYKMNLFVDFALMNITLVDASEPVPEPVPEPATLALLGGGLAALLSRKLRRA